jgi:hypothetical protein
MPWYLHHGHHRVLLSSIAAEYKTVHVGAKTRAQVRALTMLLLLFLLLAPLSMLPSPAAAKNFLVYILFEGVGVLVSQFVSLHSLC